MVHNESIFDEYILDVKNSVYLFSSVLAKKKKKPRRKAFIVKFDVQLGNWLYPYSSSQIKVSGGKMAPAYARRSSQTYRLVTAEHKLYSDLKLQWF